jgi:hypothetical protein
VRDFVEAMKTELVNMIQSDDDVFAFVMWAIGKGVRIITKDIENGRDDEMAQIYRRFITKLNLPEMIL